MGNWVTSYLTVLNAHVDPLKTIVAKLFDNNTEEDSDSEEGRTTFGFETNYGRFEEESILVEAGIAFDFSWENGGDTSCGSSYIRFNSEGELQNLFLYGDDLPALRASILKHKEETTPLPWDNQEEYGKRYLARQLITPK